MGFLDGFTKVLSGISQAMQSAHFRGMQPSQLGPAQLQQLNALAQTMTPGQQQQLRSALQQTPLPQQQQFLTSYLSQQGFSPQQASTMAAQMIPLLNTLANLKPQGSATQFGFPANSSFSSTPQGDGVNAPVIGGINKNGPSLFAKHAPVAPTTESPSTTVSGGTLPDPNGTQNA